MAGAKNIYLSYTRTDLGGALNSNAIRLTQYLRETAKAPLLVYVEDPEDIPFWQLLFKRIEDRYSEINVTTLKERAVSGEPELDEEGQEMVATGKDILMKVKGLGSNKVIAIDRDYDGLIDNYHSYTNVVRTSPYVIATTYYSMENHIISPKAVNTYLQRIIGSEKDYEAEFQSLLAKYNSTLDPALLLLLVCIERHIVRHEPIQYTISGLASDMTELNNKQDDATICKCQNAIQHNRGGLIAAYSSDIQSMKERLREHGKYPDSLWKIVQGHTLYAFASNYMSQRVKNYVDAKVSELHATYGHGDETNAKADELRSRIYAPYTTNSECAFYFPYYHPEIDFADDGIRKIIDKIKNIPDQYIGG